MIVNAFVRLISKPANLPNRLSNAEERVQAILTGPYDGRVQKDDLECIRITRDLIAPRLERLRSSYVASSQAQLLSSWHSVSWWLGIAGWNLAGLHGDRMEHIELMLYLVESRNLHDSKFWARIAQWQLATYQDRCTQLLKRYKNAMVQNGSWEEDGIQYLISKLGAAVGRALSEPEPSPKTAKFTDVFVIREIHDDPEMKAILTSDFFAQEDAQGMSRTAEEVRLDKPYFPLECYMLLK